MKILSLSTAEQGGSLAVMDDNHLVLEEFWDVKLTHSKRLLIMIEQAIEERAGLSLKDLDVYVAARGPGSFTGLRIGISVVKGLGYAMGKPVFGASSLDGIAFRFLHSNLPVCVMMDAKRNEVYSATYQFENGQLKSKTKETVESPEVILQRNDQKTLYAGSGSKAYSSLIKAKSELSVICHSFQDSVSSVALVQSLNIDDCQKNPDNCPLEPIYLRKSDAELNFDRSQV